MKQQFIIREASIEDHEFIVDLMDSALSPYYGGDHRAHAERIFSTHISGGKDQIGHFSFEQKMFIALVDGMRAGMIHIVGKRQGTYKISPLIVDALYRHKLGLGSELLNFAENYIEGKGVRQIYCTVAAQNNSALQFFINHGYIIAGHSDSHYRSGITELILYKLLVSPDFDEQFDRPHISVQLCESSNEAQVRKLLSVVLPEHFMGVNENWIDALFDGYKRRDSGDINLKYKLIYIAIDRLNKVLGVVGATPKKGKPIKLMPFVATDLPSFVALLTDIPQYLKQYGHKLYIHIIPSVEQTIAMQQQGWKIDAVLPAAYHIGHITQQWSLDIGGKDIMRLIRVKQRFLDLIKSGQKTLEVRVAYPNISTIQPGEQIRFASRAQTQVVQVKDVRKYPSIEEMIKSENVNRIAPDMSKDEIKNLLREIYPPEREKLGIVVLELGVEQRLNHV